MKNIRPDNKSDDEESKLNDPAIPDPVNEEQDGDDDLALLIECPTEIETEMITTNLESAGIEAFLLRQNDSNFPVIGNFSVIKIYVKREQLEDATEYIKDFYKQEETGE